MTPPDWNSVHPRVAKARRAATSLSSQPGVTDHNGRELAPILARFSQEEIDAARRLAQLHGHRPTLIALDPAGAGWRFLRDAVVALGGKDPGRAYYHQRTMR